MPTIYDVARRANVSIATVSRVQNGSDGVSEQTRRRVELAIEQLSYRPSRIGRSLAGGANAAVGVVFPDLAGPYYSGVILGFEQEAARHSQAVLILATHGRERVNDLVTDLAERVDGLLLMGRTVPDDLIPKLGAEGFPLVLLARPPAGRADSVRAENVGSAAALTHHLLGHGYRRLAFVGDPDSSPDAAERWQGFVSAHHAAGLADPAPPERCGMREQDGALAALAALSRDPRPDVLVCANDEIALGAYGVAQSAGLGIPDQVAVTGWDDIPVARYLSPPLTTVRQPLEGLGAAAAKALFERIDGDRTPPKQLQLPTTLVVRTSCGCATSGGQG